MRVFVGAPLSANVRPPYEDVVYFEDLTPYSYPRHIYPPLGSDKSAGLPLGLLYVGWLSPDHGFVAGPVSAPFLAKLKHLCDNPEIITFGFHVCELCAGDRQSRPCGSAEILVPGHAGRAYIAPELIVHYVQDHGYKPPDEFISAVLALGEAFRECS